MRSLPHHRPAPFALRRPTLLAPVAALTVGALLAACGVSGSAEQAASASTSASTSTSPKSASASGGAAPSASSTAKPTASATPTRTPPAGIPEAFPGAGGPAPASAIEASAILANGTAVIISPSNNIGCDLGKGPEAYAGCGVESMIQSRTMGENQVGDANWWVSLSSAPATPVVNPRGDAPTYRQGGLAPQVIPYGQAVKWGDNVCASEEVGWTCWNVVSGHGVFMNRSKMAVF